MKTPREYRRKLGATCALPTTFFALALLSSGCERQQLAELPLVMTQAQRISEAEYETTRLEVARAKSLLEGTTGPQSQRAKARLALYQADCEAARDFLSGEAVRRAKGAEELVRVAESCHGATVGATLVEDARGVWLRVQDEADLVLAPLILDVAVEAREALSKDLGVELPKPLRIDLVRDLFSLAAVSGLPVDAAETTGTVAVARWGRVTLLSPRATSHGYPWADTMAHELTHLMLSRATVDRAPLWLQEGIAKLEEERWRAKRPFDGLPNRDDTARQAEENGQAVGVTNLGPSIAMLPSAQAASIAFAEVSSFMDFWIHKNQRAGLKLLLRDIAVAPDADSAMRSVSGLSVNDWELVWRDELRRRHEQESPRVSQELESEEGLGPRARSRAYRLSQLLTLNGHPDTAAELFAPLLDRAPHDAALRYFVARAALLAKQDRDDEVLGQVSDVDTPHAGFLALRGTFDLRAQSSPSALELIAHARSLDPLLVEAACGGLPEGGADDDLHKLCRAASSLPPRGSR